MNCLGKNYLVSIDKLEIDCGVINKKNWEQDFAEEAIRKLKAELIQLNKKEIEIQKAEANKAEQTFFFFLENGFMPWNKQIENIVDLEKLISVSDEFVLQLKDLIAQNERAAERLTAQFSSKFIDKIIDVITAKKKPQLEEIYLLLEKLNPFMIEIRIVYAAILKSFSKSASNNSVKEFFISLLSASGKNNVLTSEITSIINSLNQGEIRSEILNQDSKVETDEIREKNELERKNKQIRKEEKINQEIYINNSGLVLLHPFLQTFFEHLKLTEQNQWVDEPSQRKAILILQFLITGNEQFEEFNLILNKILCGLQLDEVAETEIELSDEIKNECDDLLRSVIKNWSALKNTGIESLRETFLQRNGKLSRVDNGWLLQVQQKAVDVLLGSLPWGTGTIKIPWMKEILYVEW